MVPKRGEEAKCHDRLCNKRKNMHAKANDYGALREIDDVKDDTV